MPLETTTNLCKETINQLEELIQINIDSRDGFHHAAGAIEDMTLHSMFEALAQQRDEQAHQLSGYVQMNHRTPSMRGTLAASLHRGWMNIREALTTNNLLTVLSDLEHGEDLIKEAYEHSLKVTEGSAVNDVLLHQFAQVKSAHDRIRDLRDEHRAAANG
ncbi:PA2169 family four-helix-bundle protein [Planctomicrobium sp. SH527]|uniref:PA2169 family four-helix-bundle protein n=1 Tax=Planctomicrobium sp. SH527 TaxID=3448123 RepID=UPI003F5B06AD